MPVNEILVIAVGLVCLAIALLVALSLISMGGSLRRLADAQEKSNAKLAKILTTLLDALQPAE